MAETRQKETAADRAAQFLRQGGRGDPRRHRGDVPIRDRFVHVRRSAAPAIERRLATDSFASPTWPLCPTTESRGSLRSSPIVLIVGTNSPTSRSASCICVDKRESSADRVQRHLPARRLFHWYAAGRACFSVPATTALCAGWLDHPAQPQPAGMDVLEDVSQEGGEVWVKFQNFAWTRIKVFYFIFNLDK